MAAGANTFIDGMLRSLGFRNAAHELSGRYPTLHAEAIRIAAPDVIRAASEPFPFEEKHRAELRTLFPGRQIHFVDGEAFGLAWNAHDPRARDAGRGGQKGSGADRIG